MQPAAMDEESHINPDDLDEIDSLFFDSDKATTETFSESRLCRIVALISPKRGTGKTSVAVMLAGCLTTRRRQVGLMDLNPRSGVQRWDQAGTGLPFPIFRFNARRGPAAFRTALLAATNEVDLLILDTPTALGIATRLALEVADLVLIPAGASAQDLEAAREALAAAKDARHGRHSDLPRVMILPSRQDGRTRLAKDFAQKLEYLETPVAPAVGQRVEVAAAASSGRLVRSSTVAGKEFRRLSRHVWSFLRGLDAKEH